MPAQALGVLDRPTALRPPTSPGQQAAVLPQGGVDTDRGHLTIRFGFHGRRRGRGLVRINADQHHRHWVPSLPVDWMGGSAVDTPTSRALAGAFVVTPLLSQTANGHRAGSTHPTRANPRRRQEFYESARPVSYGNATGDQPGARYR